MFFSQKTKKKTQKKKNKQTNKIANRIRQDVIQFQDYEPTKITTVSGTARIPPQVQTQKQKKRLEIQVSDCKI
jgi:hypothetical protein